MKDENESEKYWEIVHDVMNVGKEFFDKENAIGKAKNPHNADPWQIQPKFRCKLDRKYLKGN